MIENLLKELKMYGALEYFEETGKNRIPKEEYLRAMLETEVDRRSINALNRRLKYAHFPLNREWEEIDLKRNPKIEFKRIKEHSKGKFVEENKNLCFVGAPGLGKTHSLVSIGKDLCRKGVSVKCYSACDLVTMLEEAKVNNELSKVMVKIMKPQLLIIDELGFVPFSEVGSRLLFDVFSKRYEKGSIAVSTNLSFQKWPQIFGSIELTQALIDRFTHRCDIFTFEGESVRFSESKKRKK
jgi:DNA replication protein DnaC